MALEQTLPLRNPLLLNQNPKPIIPHTFPSLNHKILRKSASAAGIRCLSDNSGGTTDPINNQKNKPHAAKASKFPPPPEIAFSWEINNQVNLIGKVIFPITTKIRPSRRIVANTSLLFVKPKSETTWIKLCFFDELAGVASQYVYANQTIHVSGYLTTYLLRRDANGGRHLQTMMIVKQLNLVENDKKYVTWSSKVSRTANSDKSDAPKKEVDRAVEYRKTLELWQSFFANPTEWFDNRKIKKNSRSPDFRHKETGEVLWADGWNNPPWIKNQLAILDSKMESFYDKNPNGPVSFIDVNDLF